MNGIKVLTAALVLTLTACSALPSGSNAKQQFNDEAANVVSYFKEIAFGSEFGSNNTKLRKWQNDINILVVGQPSAYLEIELSKIIKELNELISTITIKRVESQDSANYIIHFGSARSYELIEPNAKSKTKDNWGLFWVYWNQNHQIYRGSMYVDTQRTKSVMAQKHLLREELTQSLGLMNDSYRYEDSIFYQKWSYTTNYSDLDKRLIKLLYNPELRTGIAKSEFKTLINSSELIPSM